MEKIRNWKQDFYTIWAGQAVSLITSGVLQMAIIWHLTNTTGSAMVLSMATLVGFLPQAVLGSAIGVLVDRWNRKMVMIGADVIIACAGLVLTVISLSAELPVWIVMLILFIRRTVSQMCRLHPVHPIGKFHPTSGKCRFSLCKMGVEFCGCP